MGSEHHAVSQCEDVLAHLSRAERTQRDALELLRGRIPGHVEALLIIALGELLDAQRLEQERRGELRQERAGRQLKVVNK